MQATPRFDAQRRPWRVQPIGEALGSAHEAGRARVFTHTDENAITRRPWSGNRVGLHVV